MVHFLGIIEQKTNEILSAYHNYVKSKSTEESNDPGLQTSSESTKHGPVSFRPSILGVGPSAPMGAETLFVNPPKLADYSSDDGSGDEGDARPH